VIVAIFAFPALPLDDLLLAVLSIGVPIGLGIYLAWVDRGRPTTGRRVGLAGSLAGALVGAWLGFHVTSGLMAVVTTIAGAAVGANLTLILLDVVRGPAFGEATEPPKQALATAGV
jgi:hypothetical protein